MPRPQSGPPCCVALGVGGEGPGELIVNGSPGPQACGEVDPPALFLLQVTVLGVPPPLPLSPPDLVTLVRNVPPNP
jgi:hypothetical protein